MSNAIKAYVAQPGESELRWMGEGTATWFLATGASTGGEFALVEEKATQGVSVPLHKHDADVESFYVLEGEMLFFLGEEPAMRAAAGAFVHIPAGTVHGFRIESGTARYLILTTPHHAMFYRAISAPSPSIPIGDELISAACEEYGIDFVGPLPG